MTEIIELDDDALTCDSEDPNKNSNSNSNDSPLSIQLRSQFELIRSLHDACSHHGQCSNKQRDNPYAYVEEVSVLSSSYESEADYEQFELQCSSEQQDLHQLQVSLAIAAALKVESEIASLSAGISELEALFFQQEQQEHHVQQHKGADIDAYQNGNGTSDEIMQTENGTGEEQSSICTSHVTKSP